jgi:hypothetical protein
MQRLLQIGGHPCGVWRRIEVACIRGQRVVVGLRRVLPEPGVTGVIESGRVTFSGHADRQAAWRLAIRDSDGFSRTMTLKRQADRVVSPIDDDGTWTHRFYEGPGKPGHKGLVEDHDKAPYARGRRGTPQGPPECRPGGVRPG